jgi:hypothetical protein
VPSVFFYISGHGFGHASRQVEIINALGARCGRHVEIVVRTSVPRWLFDRTAATPFTLLDGQVDTGVVQIDSLRLDEAATIAQAAAFHATLPDRARHEAALLREHRARLVVSDAPPLACAAAHAAGIPSVVCSNFTWDWIYEGYGAALENAPGLIPALQNAYRCAAAGLRLPMHGGFAAISPVVDVPFVARHARADRTAQDVLRDLRLPSDGPLALVSFGGYGARDLPLDRLDCLGRWTIVLTSAHAEAAEHGIRVIRDQQIYESGLRYPDLVGAVDVVVTKPGYGIVSECIANDTAILYTSRGRFLEYDVLVAAMPRYLRCGFIDHEALFAGRWAAALDRVLAAPSPPERARTDGAEVVADWIRQRLA